MGGGKGLFAAALAVWLGVFAISAHAGDRWKTLQFLIGDWAATGGGATGPSAGGAYSFKAELNDQILVRHSYAEYGAGQQRHDDLLIVYAETPGKPMRAIYFDSEGHVIKYSVKPSASSVVFESDPAEPGPKYRLSYRLVEKNLTGKFEIAEGGNAGYKTYLAWTSVRK